MICLVCEPVHLRIAEVINSFHTAALDNPPELELALKQHAGLVAALEALGVRVLKVPPLPEAPYQVFTRDVLIGGIGDPILASFREPIRRPETEVLIRTLERVGIPFVASDGGYLEGGDVVVSDQRVFVGVGDRTERGAAEWLRESHPDREVHILEMEAGYLHLDMVFNVFGPDSCLVYPAALAPEGLEKVRACFSNIFEIDAADQKCMSTNFLPVGANAGVVSSSAVDGVVEAASAAGRSLDRVDLGEIQKAGGSIRCSTCLLETLPG